MFVILMINKNKDGGMCVNQEDKLFLSLYILLLAIFNRFMTFNWKKNGTLRALSGI